MKKHVFCFVAILLVGLAAMHAVVAHATDNQYFGVHITVPFTFDAVGAQFVARQEIFEFRAGIDTREKFQVGAGLTAGNSDSFVGSGGLAYSSFQKEIVPYLAITYGSDWEGGIVSYQGDRETTYAFIGLKGEWTDEDNGSNGSRQSSVGSSGDAGTEGVPAGDSVPGGDSGTGGDSSGDPGADGAGNRSGLGDGTNPGRGGGRDNSPNQGTNNPHN